MRRYSFLLVCAVLCGCLARDPYGRMAAGLSAPLRDERTRIAVLPFHGLGPDGAALGATVAERLVSRLHGRRGVELVERIQLDQVLSEPSLSAAGAVDPASARRIGKLIGADALVVGSVSRGPSFLSVEARIVESESGRVLSASSGRVPLEEADPGPVPPPGRSAQAGQPRLPRAVGAPAVAVMGGRVYVAGGTARGSPSGTGVTEVLSAPIDGRGRVGAWRQEEPLPSARYQTVGAAADGAVFVIGGYQGSPRDEVFVSLASSEGRLGPWRTAGRLPAGGSGCTAVVAARTLFVGGCAAASGTDARVHAAVLRGDAALGPWTSVAQPAPAHSAAMVHAAGRLYLLGGSTGVPPRTAAVHSIAVRPGGFDGEFRDEEPMPAAAQHNGAAVVGGRLYSAGGITGDPGAASADVFSAAIDGEGRLRGWRRELRRLPAPRIPGPMPVWDGRGYLVSDFGSISDEVTVVPDDLVAVPPAGFGTLPSSP